MQWFDKTSIDFVSKRKTFFYFSVILFVVTLIGTIVLGPVLGIDFAGGTEIAVGFDKSVSTEDVRNALSKGGIKGGEIKSFGEAGQYLVRVAENDSSPETITNILAAAFPSSKMNILKIDKIGPKIGAELRNDAIWAVVLAVIFILMYIAFRFDFVFGMGAIVALIHDVFLTFTLVVVINHLGIIDLELNQSIMAALLTVVGYSINDTVIIFDRIRENLENQKGSDLPTLINRSINETLSRTVNTVATTLVVLLTIILFGGPILQGFAFTMFLGIILGTYSSIFIASSFVIWYNQKVKSVSTTKTNVQTATR